MKLLIGLILWASFINYAMGATFIIHEPCDKRPSFIVKESIVLNETVGDFTVRILEKFKIPFQGNSAGINQIKNSPIGKSSLEVVNNFSMRAYGWCYSLNNKLVEEYPSQVMLDENSKVYWFYAYAEYYVGSWISQCQPSYKLKSDFICK